MNSKKEFGRWLKEERLKNDLTQDQLAKLLDLNHSQEIAAIESGSIAFSHKKAGLLSKAFGVPKEIIIKNLSQIKEQKMIDDSNEFDKLYKKKGLL